MGLIIKDSIPMMIVGFPTISDKYNVAGATLTGSTSVAFGDLIKYSDTAGYFEGVAATEVITIDKIAGIILGTNVKLADGFPASTVSTNPGEAFNLTLPGTYMAVELASSAVTDNIKAGNSVYVKLTGGFFTTSGDADGTEWPAAVFTGTYETHDGTLVAEIYIK